MDTSMNAISKVEPRGGFLDVTLDNGELYSVVWDKTTEKDHFWGKSGIGTCVPDYKDELNVQLLKWVQENRPVNLVVDQLRANVFHLQSEIEDLLNSFIKSNGHFDISINVSEADSREALIRRKDGFTVKVNLELK